MRKLMMTLALLTPFWPSAPATAQDWAWVLSIPHAISHEYVYKVRVLAIDGTPQKELLRYGVGAGEHTFTVQMMLDVEWEPDLSATDRRPPIKQIAVRIETGRTYYLAARIDIDAPVESQLDQSFWEPFVYRVD